MKLQTKIAEVKHYDFSTATEDDQGTIVKMVATLSDDPFGVVIKEENIVMELGKEYFISDTEKSFSDVVDMITSYIAGKGYSWKFRHEGDNYSIFYYEN